VRELVEEGARRSPDSMAILGLGRQPLTYRGLRDHQARIAAELNGLGIARNDRVAIVLPNGPEMATAFLSVAACATSAPLNPAYRAEEYDFYLSDLNAKAIIVQAGVDSAARGAAKARGIPILELEPTASAPAGVFTLRPRADAPSRDPRYAEPGDEAMVLHTSGTTSRPKIVPLTQTNLCVSAGNIGASLALTPADRCLNVMPLFHIHGLMAATLASLRAGASIACTPGFLATSFFDWMDLFEPTWYTAVPTMHQAIVMRAAQAAEIIARRRLRFLRSSSSSLPPQVMAQLEEVFGAPVIEAYGMTEAAHQMASNPLPPRPRKPGTVGMAAGPEIAVMDDQGNLLPGGQTGEIVIRGANVTPGYESNPEANATAFTNGWFRTGDQGVIDGEGYLSLTGRLKEIINRAGEKISPREVDEVILDHPAVAQVVTFAVPDAKLGEDVGAAIVLRPGQTATSQQIRQFAAERLTDFKLPRHIVFLDEIPKGPTGKLQRIGLAAKLGIPANGHAEPQPAQAYEPPSTAVEKLVAGIWVEVLKVQPIGAKDDFLALGGDSVLATRLVSRIRDQLDLDISVAAFFEAPTVATQARVIEDMLLAEG
jgi:acyl-CoA synthetase (AMP-forming)/AMP-acid ligase II/acyl carrier protein